MRTARNTEEASRIRWIRRNVRRYNSGSILRDEQYTMPDRLDLHGFIKNCILEEVDESCVDLSAGDAAAAAVSS